MFGEPEVEDRPGAVQKRKFGENLERTDYSPDYKKKLLSMERFAYAIPDGSITLVFILNKLDNWKFFPG